MLGSKLVSGDSNLCSPKVAKTFMNHFDLYYAYLARCERNNWINDLDPHHYEMEWNHTLPQCIFKGHGPGQWLTLKQHAIASALQTLAFGRNCVCGWHVKHIPLPLLTLTRPFYSEMTRKQGVKSMNEGVGLFSLTKADLSVAGKKGGRLQGPKSGIKSYEEGYGIFAYTREERIEINRKGGERTLELGVGVFAPENLGKGCKVTNKQKWVSTLDGFVSTAAGVASHNRSVGGTGKDKIKLTQQ